jgi:2-polyprenyl-3-methyl-5-hydroxy-6-metoxy-1,4-benzoquinol methylase/uncharacterized protein YbaR (Trm112 family)
MMPITEKSEFFYSLLRCPVTGNELRFQRLSAVDGLLWATDQLVYPVIDGIPRLLPEAMIDYAEFLTLHIPDLAIRFQAIPASIADTITYCERKNRRTKESFAFEWSHFQYGQDKTWDADESFMFQRFLRETDETAGSLNGKIVLDVGCGNGVLDRLIGEAGALVVAMDMSRSIEQASRSIASESVFFIQGDLQYPPIKSASMDLVQCSGVLIHTNSTRRSFFTIEKTVKKDGKLSVWVYHQRKDAIHRFFNVLRNYTSQLPLRVQYYLYLLTLLPVSFLIKRIKGNKQNVREMMVDILDWFTPEYRWEHSHEEVADWFRKAGYEHIQKTTVEVFGFNTTGVKKG